MPADPSPTPVRQRVAQALAERPHGVTAATLVEATGASRASISKSLSALERDGRARRHRPEPTEPTRPVPDTWYPATATHTSDDAASEPPPDAESHLAPGPQDPAPPSTEPDSLDEQPAARRTRDGRPVARPGQLRALVAQHLIDYPDSEFTPGEIAKVLSRSSGAVANALEKLTDTGEARRTCDAPRRYQTRPE